MLVEVPVLNGLDRKQTSLNLKKGERSFLRLEDTFIQSKKGKLFLPPGDLAFKRDLSDYFDELLQRAAKEDQAGLYDFGLIKVIGTRAAIANPLFSRFPWGQLVYSKSRQRTINLISQNYTLVPYNSLSTIVRENGRPNLHIVANLQISKNQAHLFNPNNRIT